MSKIISSGQILRLSCTQLAKATNIDKGCWSRYLNGEFMPSTTNLLKISKALNLSAEEVLNEIEQRKACST